MRELTFFTTNQTKLAHARYVAEGRQIRIKGFRQRTYHADYIEPRLTSREDILRASYEGAKAQLAKAGFSEASHPFFLEDTSVRIDAISTAEREVPGVDIKYWMEDRTFSSLDMLLRHARNDRRATVRSDVLLHIPSSFRADWDVNAEFLVFTGEQRGTIVETEYIFDANLVYPWLDNRSFNKWFVPDGADRLFGALPIEIADTADFRRKSFGPLFDFLDAMLFRDPGRATPTTVLPQTKHDPVRLHLFGEDHREPAPCASVRLRAHRGQRLHAFSLLLPTRLSWADAYRRFR